VAKPKDPTTVRELTPHAHNPRKINDKRLAQLAKSMAAFGDLSSVTYNRRTGRLVSGHQRAKNLLANARITKKAYTDDSGTVAVGTITSGKQSWPYREVDVDEKTESAMLIAANAAGGEFDDVKLSKLVKDLDGAGFDTDLLNLDSLEDILASDGPEESDAADSLPSVPKKATSKPGEVWILGPHRLVCGDSTSTETLQRLMGHDRAACVTTDPPYGVSYDAKSGEFAVIEGDRKRDDELYQLVAGALKQAVAFTTPTAAFYVWHASSTRREFDDALRAAGLSERQYLIWVKNAIVLGRADYHWSHEPCYYAAKTGERPAWHGDRAQPTVWRATWRTKGAQATTLGQALVLTDGDGGSISLVPRLAKGKKSRGLRLGKGETLHIETASEASTVLEVGRDHDYIHPTQKPVDIFTTPIRNSTKPGEIVLDLFGGSGTTLMACEATGRHARLVELDPKYVDAIVQRWQDATQQKAVLEK
jgi:DNA modification methylase